MNPVIPTYIREIIGTVHYRPAVTLVLPFQPRIALRTEIDHSLKVAIDKVERELHKNYPEDLASVVLNRLRKMARELRYDTDKKTIVLFASPLFEKTVHLDIPLEEKIIIDESFEIRDLLYDRKAADKYLVLVLGGKDCSMFLGTNSELTRVKLNIPESVYAYINEIPEKVANFSDTAERREVVMEKYYQHIDHALEEMLNSYKVPVFVLGTDRQVGHYRTITRNAKSIFEFVPGNFEGANIPSIQNKLGPVLQNLKSSKQQQLLKKIDEAAGSGRLVYGINNVWKEATGNKGRLLVVEKDYMVAARQGGSPDWIEAVEDDGGLTTIRDAVDDVMEKVLESGGDVEFVDQDVLKDFGHIALIKYY